jgi:transcriptional regulator with XRE-family HTH domain
VLKTPKEILHDLGVAVRARRLAQGWSQEDAAARAGIGLRTWRRMETDGLATMETVVNAAIALRCEEGISRLFPQPAAGSLDELLKRQAAAAAPKPRQRAPRRRKAP